MGIEILAPAGGPESLEAAVRCGADAVYLGAKAFSARGNASNFDGEELESAVKYCHKNGVKVYAAVNTLVFDTQLGEVEKTLRFLAKTGIDALIVQDLGVAFLASKILPDMPLHASTQMSLHTPMGAEFAEKMGFSRVVPARELSKKQLELLCKEPVEIEYFVHGALCMSVSGQCYMSAMIGSRSANRGFCAQACRLPFSADSGCEASCLSLKDLSLIEKLDEIEEIGVDSAKIEGRMKRPEYVAAAVTACRKQLDGETPDIETLRAVFSRGGFTDGYYTERIGKPMFGVRSKEDVVAAADVLPQLKQLYKSEYKKFNLQFVIEAKSGKPTRLIGEIAGLCRAEALGDIPQQAQNKPLTLESASQSLEKLGDTPYIFGGVTGDIDGGLFLPASALNALRRSVTEQLDDLLAEHFTPKYTECNYEITGKGSLAKKARKLRIFAENAAQLALIGAEKFELAFLPLDEIEKSGADFTKIGAVLPRWTDDESVLEKRLEKLKNAGLTHIYANNAAHIMLGKKFGFSMHGGFGLNITNSLSLGVLKDFGLADTEASFELKLPQIRGLSEEIPVGIIAYGRLPLMLTRNCPISSQVGCKSCKGKITDRTGREFPIACRGDHVEILNSDMLVMSDRLGEVSADFLSLRFFDESPEAAANVINDYLRGVNSLEKYTRGLYYRGIN